MQTFHNLRSIDWEEEKLYTIFLQYKNISNVGQLSVEDVKLYNIFQ